MPTERISSEQLKEHLKTKRLGKKIIVCESTSSTNDMAAEYGKNIENDGLIIFSEEQIKGRGRSGAQWISKSKQSILCSIVLTKGNYSCELLSLTTAVAVAEAIGKIRRNNAKIKWPNDIILNRKKIAGILIESKSEKGNNFFIIGIGINCHQQINSFPNELKETATSFDIENQTICDRISIAKRLITSMDHWLKIADKNSKKVIKNWRKLSIELGHRVTLTYNGNNFAGNCIGIDPEKGLILQLDRGGVRMFEAAYSNIVK